MKKPSRLDTRTLVGLAAVACLPGLVLLTAVPAAAAPAAVQGVLLPLPEATTNLYVSTRAVDVAPAGIVAANREVTTVLPDGTVSTSTSAQRWLFIPGRGWVRQELRGPAGYTGAQVAGLTNLGEAGGNVTVDGQTRPVRWSVDGRRTHYLGSTGSYVTAVGPYGPWGLTSPDPADPSISNAELVARNGERTALTGTPELSAGYARRVLSIGGRGTAVVGVFSGVRRYAIITPVLWQGGRTVSLPTYFSSMVLEACVSAVQADGSVAYSGPLTGAAEVRTATAARHVDGVPGRNIELQSFDTPTQYVGLGCTSTPSDRLASDGGVAGQYVTEQGPTAAYWDADGRRTLIERLPGEDATTGVAVATGGRVVVESTRISDGKRSLSLWQSGTRLALELPAGWNLSDVVELTDGGVLIANVYDATARETRPAAWQIGAGRSLSDS